jgi:hypothetical protein
VVDPLAARVTTRIAIAPATPLAHNVAYYAFDAFWVAQPGRIWKVSVSGAVSSAELPPDLVPTTMTISEHWLWLGSVRRLVRIEPQTLATSVTSELPVPAGIAPLLGTKRGLFAVGWNQSKIWILDPDSGLPITSMTVGDKELVDTMVDTGTGIWAIGNCGNVMRFNDGGSGPEQKVRISYVSQDFPTRAALGSLWLGDQVSSELVRLDISTGAVLARLPVDASDPDDPLFDIVAGQQSVWVIDRGVSRVDPVTNRVLRLTQPTSESMRVSAAVAAPPR